MSSKITIQFLSIERKFIIYYVATENFILIPAILAKDVT